MRRCSKTKPKTKAPKIRNHVNRNDAVVNLEKNKVKELVVKLQKLDLETIKKFSNEDHVNTRESNLHIESIENVKETDRRKCNSKRETIQKKEEISAARDCTKTERKELLTEKKNYIKKLKKLKLNIMERKSPRVILQRLDLNTTQQYLNNDIMEEPPSVVVNSCNGKTDKSLLETKDADSISERKDFTLKEKGIYTQSNCTYSNDEKLSSSVRLKEKYPIVKLKKLSPEVIELYLNMNLLKNSNKPIVKVKKLDLNTIEQNSSDCSISKRLTTNNSEATKKGILKKRSCQSTVRTRSQRIKKKEESVSTNPAVSNIQCEFILPPNPCKNGCDRVCELISEERRYQLNRHFQSLNSSFEKAAFLNNIIRYRWDEDEDIVICDYYININGINQRVCLKFLLATLNIEIEFIMNHIKQLVEMNKITFFKQKSNLS